MLYSFPVFCQALFPAASELGELWAEGALPACVMSITQRPLVPCFNRLTAYCRAAMRACQPCLFALIGSLSFCTLALTMTQECVPFRQHRENVSAGHPHSCPLEHFRDFWLFSLQDKTVLLKVKRGDLEGGVHDM